jgi:hypothetical protein
MRAGGCVKAGLGRVIFLVILSLSSFSSDGNEPRKAGRQQRKKKEKE